MIVYVIRLKGKGICQTFSPHESINQNIYVKKLEENLLEVFYVPQNMPFVYLALSSCLSLYMPSMQIVTVVNILLAVLSLSRPISVSNFCLKSSDGNTDAVLISLV